MNSTGVTGAQKVSCFDSFNHVWSQIVLGVGIFLPAMMDIYKPRGDQSFSVCASDAYSAFFRVDISYFIDSLVFRYSKTAHNT